MKISNLACYHTTLNMHNLLANIEYISELTYQALNSQLDKFNNFRPYPNRPKVPDLQIVAIAIVAEMLSIDSENLLYAKLKTEHPDFFTQLPDRSNYNRRKRAMRNYIDQVTIKLGDAIDKGEKVHIIDSMPVPVCRYARAKRLKIMKDQPDLMPNRGRNHIDKTAYFGFKFHVILSKSGVVKNYILAPAKEHDVTKLMDLSSSLPNKYTVLGDKGYISNSIQYELFVEKHIRVFTPVRKNMKAETEWTSKMGKDRKRIETFFSQLCDQMMFKRNYAKTVVGLLGRIAAKIAASTCLQFINFNNGKPLNRLKHALAF